jgi:outer membrane protein TolC
VLTSHDALVQLGRELPVEKEEANLNFLRAQQRLLNLQSDREYGERSLAVTLGYGAGDSVQTAPEERTPPPIPDTEEAALKIALEGNNELKRLASSYQAKALEIGGDKAQRLPRVDLVAEYDLLATYSNYQEYFARFKRNNAEIGASIQIPLLAGPGAKAAIQQAENEQQHLRAEMDATRNRIMLDVHQSFVDVRKANIANQVAKAEVDLAHSRLSVLLAQMNEGRATLKQVEEARFAEDEKWSGFYDAQFSAEKARLNVLKQTGALAAALGLQ